MESTRKHKTTEQIGRKMLDFFQSEEVEQMARKTKFVQRNSRVNGYIFLKALVFGYLENARASLTHLASLCADLDTPISPQGVDERINARAVAFLAAIFRQAMQLFQNRLPLPLPILTQFSAIYLVDSSVQALPEAMRADYPGCGGAGAPSSLKIQLVFELLCGNLRQVVLQAGRTADQAYRDYLGELLPGSLTIVDLGYFALDAFQTIAHHSAFFLSRYLYPTGLQDPDQQLIDWPHKLQSYPGEVLDIPILLGRRHQIPARLISIRVSPAIAAERRRKAREKARQHHKTPTQAYLQMLDWTVFVTNVPVERLSYQQIVVFYRLRWQVELIFKLWKSYAGWRKIGLWRSDRVLVELYAKMIGMVLFHFLIAPLRIPDETWCNREISLFKTHHILARYSARLMIAMPDDACFLAVLEIIVSQALHLAQKQHRVKRPSSCQSLAGALA